MLDAAFAALIATATAGPLPVRVRQRVCVVSTGRSETPLPEGFAPASLRQNGTRGFASTHSIASQLQSVADQLKAVSVLKINAEDEALVARVIAENVPKATTKRRLARRTTK